MNRLHKHSNFRYMDSAMAIGPIWRIFLGGNSMTLSMVRKIGVDSVCHPKCQLRTFRVTEPVFRFVKTCKFAASVSVTSILARYCRNGMIFSSCMFLREHQTNICAIFLFCLKNWTSPTISRTLLLSSSLATGASITFAFSAVAS